MSPPTPLRSALYPITHLCHQAPTGLALGVFTFVRSSPSPPFTTFRRNAHVFTTVVGFPNFGERPRFRPLTDVATSLGAETGARSSRGFDDRPLGLGDDATLTLREILLDFRLEGLRCREREM
ncbi:hypothetical protein L6452_01571 [Arctium lappa]|uniref:Uncharacterized protein n=1 Tax=Arctium lappa TaxID=4217 RepID=A0ACB9FGH4_ARCLA|nr:hypothetical protein L6452_01571 [Arctium lappa]